MKRQLSPYIVLLAIAFFFLSCEENIQTKLDFEYLQKSFKDSVLVTGTLRFDKGVNGETGVADTVSAPSGVDISVEVPLASYLSREDEVTLFFKDTTDALGNYSLKIPIDGVNPLLNVKVKASDFKAPNNLVIGDVLYEHETAIDTTLIKGPMEINILSKYSE